MLQLCGLIILGVFFIVGGAASLQLACYIYNRLAGPAAAVPEPRIGKAIGLAVVTQIVCAGAGFVLAFVTHEAGKVLRFPGAVGIIGLSITFLVLTGLLTAMLPTSFGRACLVALLALVIGFVIAAIIAVGRLVIGF
jgi:hypothetical protein